MAKKTEYLGLPITDNPDLRFAEWWRLINGEETIDNKPSAFQMLDDHLKNKVVIKDSNGEQQGGIYFDKNLGIAANVNTNEELEKMQNIQIGKKIFKMGDSEYSNEKPTTATVGGIEEGTTFDKLSIQEVLDKLLYPYIPPKITLSGKGAEGGLHSIDTVNGNEYFFVEDITVTIVFGSEKINKIEVYDGETLLVSKEENIIEGDNFLKLTYPLYIVNDKQLSVKVYDSKNVIEEKGKWFKFVYPYYVGKLEEDERVIESNINDGVSRKYALEKGTHTFEIIFNRAKPFIAYPKSYSKLKQIKDLNGFDMTDLFVLYEIKIQGINYYVYVLSNIATSVMKYTISY